MLTLHSNDGLDCMAVGCNAKLFDALVGIVAPSLVSGKGIEQMLLRTCP